MENNENECKECDRRERSDKGKGGERGKEWMKKRERQRGETNEETWVMAEAKSGVWAVRGLGSEARGGIFVAVLPLLRGPAAAAAAKEI